MEEIWKDILGYEGKYQVSNLGRIKSLYREYILRCSVIKVQERILKPQLNNMGYECVGLCHGQGKVKITLVHRIVAVAFCSNLNSNKVVNHIDGNCRNNIPENLEWCNQAHNVKEGFRLGRKPVTGDRNGKSKGCINVITGETVPTIAALALKLNYHNTHVSAMLRGHRRNTTYWVKINP